MAAAQHPANLLLLALPFRARFKEVVVPPERAAGRTIDAGLVGGVGEDGVARSPSS